MNLTTLTERYAAAKRISYKNKCNFDQSGVEVAVKYAVEDFIAEFKRFERDISEAYAIEVMTMEMEDAESAAK